MHPDCIPWLGSLFPNGYGRLDGRVAHRVIYEALIGPVPEGLQLDHLCRNRACVNVNHLEPVTQRENIRRGSRPNQTHCKRGHEYTPENTYRRGSSGARQCRACQRRSDRIKSNDAKLVRKLPVL